jgi:hypothetical protein
VEKRGIAGSNPRPNIKYPHSFLPFEPHIRGSAYFMLFSQKDKKRDFVSILYQFPMRLSQTQGVSASYFQTSEIHYCCNIGLHYMHNLYFHVMHIPVAIG